MQHHEETERLNEARRQNAIAKERRTAAGWDSTLLRINHESYLPTLHPAVCVPPSLQVGLVRQNWITTRLDNDQVVIYDIESTVLVPHHAQLWVLVSRQLCCFQLII